MTHTPEDAYASNVPVPDDRFNTDGLELESIDGEQAPAETAPVAEEDYSAEQQAADAERYSVVEKPAEVSETNPETMTEQEREAQVKEFSDRIEKLLWSGDTATAASLIEEAKEKSVDIDLKSVVDESIRNILVETTTRTYGKIPEVVKVAEQYSVQPDLQTLYQEELNKRSQKSNPEDLQVFMDTAEEQGIEVNLDVERVAKDHRDFIAGNLRGIIDGRGITDQLAINNVFIAIDFAKKHGVDLGDVKDLVVRRKEEIKQLKSENERVGFEYHDYLNEQILELNLLMAKL